MNILHVITMLDIGGAERLLVDMLPRLRQYGHEVDVLVFNGIDSPFKDELCRNGINVIEISQGDAIHYHFNVYNPLNVVKIRKYLGRYDIIHTHNTACQLYVPFSMKFRKSKAKLVTTEHSTSNRRRSSRWFKTIDKWMYGQYDRIVCVSEKTFQNLISYLGAADNICTIENGVNIERFINQIPSVCKKRKYVITMVAAFREEKDHETLLRAIKRLPSNYTLQLVGAGLRLEQVKTECDQLLLSDRVTFLGNRSDVPDLIGASDIVVLSSHWEGLSLSSIEGMASGRPFVASDVDGLREMVDGAGVLFEHGNDKELAEKIQWLCEHPDDYREVAQRCQERARQYDISVMVEKYIELYNSLFHESR